MMDFFLIKNDEFCIENDMDAYKDDPDAGWTVVFETQIAVTCFGWLVFTLFYPSEGGVLIR